ncbi:NfeD family protein [Desulfovermiculus halophilus]|jgi:membrane protein implicated in regulation of membrane protease activity|uniref:NfeD family protein n=1 Tax=Desulfovermiculus halophilus TaxID=339722 RepID=UPI0004842311|nr:NfeD family protein [Desulfovermiculus halophilus]
MLKTGWSKRTVVTYTLLQLPGALLVALALVVAHARFGLPAGAAWSILVLWIVKDSILFFFLWPAYDKHNTDVYTLIGRQASAATDLSPGGRVRLRGQTWPARAEPSSCPIPAGSRVEILDREGLVLIVRPLKTEKAGA